MERLKAFWLSRNALIVSNIVFLILVIITSIICMQSKSLIDFFEHSVAYLVCTIVDAFKNLVYTPILFYYGWKLKSRILDFTSRPDFHQERTDDNSTIIILEQAIMRLLAVVSICISSTILRCCMLTFKVLFVQLGDQVPPVPWVEPYGIYTKSDMVILYNLFNLMFRDIMVVFE
jgi:hypothetical protein